MIRITDPRFKKVIPVFIVGLLMTSSFLLGVFFGRGYIRQIGPFKIKPIIINKETGKPNEVDFSLFWEAWNSLEKNYVGEVDYEKMLYGAIKGASESVGDPYTVYYDPSESKEFLEEIDGSFSGIGIEVAIRNKELVVITPLSGTPADKAGLRAKDKILKIDEKETSDMTIDEAVKKIRGQQNTQVTLLVQRGNDEPKEYKITRDIIKIESVKLEYKEINGKKIAVITLSKFDSDVSDRFNKVVEDILINQPSGVILDLRGNPGGYLEKAVDIASEFFDGGLITREESKNGEKKDYNTTKNGRLTKQPLVVLINSGSASASEIVAGALKDRKRGTVVGEKSFGKGSVQAVFNLEKGVLKITVAKWLTPGGRNINNEGIEPDIKKELKEDDILNDRDPQMEEALKII